MEAGLNNQGQELQPQLQQSTQSSGLARFPVELSYRVECTIRERIDNYFRTKLWYSVVPLQYYDLHYS